MTTIKLTQDPFVTDGGYRLFAENGKPTCDVIDGYCYEAAAVDAEGNDYKVIWTVCDDFDVNSEDDSDACDWNNPFIIFRGNRDVTKSVRIG